MRIGVAAAVLLGSLRVALAEDGTETATRRVVEEIVVTAQKREQAVTEVPISMSVLDDEFIVEQGVTDVRDALVFTPNVKVDTSVLAGTPRCRGLIVNGLNRAFEPPCSLALDGVPYTRPAYFQAALFDLQRIEVLRGPQGTTFGKNSTAGVIQVITKKPTDEFTGAVDVQLGELDHRRLEAAIGGPILPGFVNFRLAGISEERDGFMTNTTAAISPGSVRRPGRRDREGFRAKVAFPDLFGSELQLSYEDVDLEIDGQGGELFDLKPAVESFLRGYDPNADFKKGNLVVSQNDPSGAHIEIQTLQADWSREVFDWSVDAVIAHSVLDEPGELDVLFTPAPEEFLRQGGVNETTTVEVRTLSPELPGFYGLSELFGWNLGRSEVLAGVFYQRRNLKDSEFFLRIHDVPFLALLAAAEAPAGTPFPSLPPIGEDVAEELTSRFEQDASTIAGFAQFQWFFAERWMLQYGMRISSETKDAEWHQRVSDPSPILAIANFQEFDATDSLSELEFQPKITLHHEPFEGVSLFAHWTRGFKGGGFNALSGTADQASLTFDPEAVTEWGVDAKTTLLGGTATLNVSLFRMEIDDFQVFTRILDPSVGLATGTQVVNAAEARAQGIEADLMYLPTDWLTIIGTVGLNDTKYVDFRINECAIDRPDTDGDGDERCDASGRPFAFAPEWNNTLTASVRYPIVWGLELASSLTVEFIDVHFLDEDLDPRRRQPSFFRLRASAGIRSAERGWSLRILGENLTDEVTSIRQNDSSIGFIDVPEPPRHVLGQFRWEF